MDRQAKSISMSQLSAAVAKAVEAEQQKGAVGGAFMANHPIIMGRWFNGTIDMVQAEGLATRITQQVEQSPAGVAMNAKLQPAFIWHGGPILCGFILDEARPLAE